MLGPVPAIVPFVPHAQYYSTWRQGPCGAYPPWPWRGHLQEPSAATALRRPAAEGRRSRAAPGRDRGHDLMKQGWKSASHAGAKQGGILCERLWMHWCHQHHHGLCLPGPRRTWSWHRNPLHGMSAEDTSQCPVTDAIVSCLRRPAGQLLASAIIAGQRAITSRSHATTTVC